MLYFKDNIIVGSPTKELIQAIYVVAHTYATFTPRGYNCWITSLADGSHAGKPVDDSGKDPHYVGKAVDFRIKNVAAYDREGLIDKIKTDLGPPYVVLRENVGAENEHLHVQTGKAKE